MRRRKVLLGISAGALGAGSLSGTTAFSSVTADRDISVSVVGDAEAYLRVAPCTGPDGEPHPNSQYASVSDDGLLSIDFSAENPTEAGGTGVSPESRTVVENVFELCNQGTQQVCVSVEIDPPQIPDDASVPDRYSFGPGAPAVVLRRSSSHGSSETVSPDRANTVSLSVGSCVCFGFEIRAFGFGVGRNLLKRSDLRIHATAGDVCTDQ